MPYNHEDVQLSILGSRSLNQMKADINTFFAMFVHPYDEITVSRHGKFKTLRTLQLPQCLIIIGTHKRGIYLKIQGADGHSFDNGAEYISLRATEDVWLGLHELLSALEELVPEIKGNVDFFRVIGQRTADRNRQE